MLFKLSGERIPPLALNLFKNAIAIVLLAATLAFLRQGIGTLLSFPAKDIWLLVLSGFLGIALADTMFFKALNLIGVGLISVVDCLYSPMVIMFSALLLGERLGVSGYVGAALIVGGVSIASRHEPPAGRTRRQLLAGILLGALALAFMTFGIVIAKPSLERFSLVWATMLRVLVGTAVLAVFATLSSQRREHWSAFRPSQVWKWAIPGAVLGTYFAMFFWVAAFKYAKASIAAILSQTSVVFAMILAALVLKESFNRRKAVAVTLALLGVATVWLKPFQWL